MRILPLLRHLGWIAIAVLVLSISTAHAEQRVWPPQAVQGYTITLSMAAQPAPGDNAVVVAIQDAAGRAVDGAEVSIALIAYIQAVSTNPKSPNAPNQHVHTAGASATEGQGLIPLPVPLDMGAEAGTYRGVVSFAKEGTWTAVVAFTMRGQARAVLFKLGVIDQRPRLALLAGFAVVNVGVIVVAAVRKRTKQVQHNRPAHLSAVGTGRPPPSS